MSASDAVAVKRCIKLAAEAHSAQAQGQQLLAADKYLEATLAARHCWHRVRFNSFNQFLGMLESRRATIRPKTLASEALKRLESMAKDRKELAFFRAKSYAILSANAGLEYQNDLAANYQRAIISVAEESRKVQRSHSPGSLSERDIILEIVTQGPTKMGAYIDEMAERANIALYVAETATEMNSMFGSEGESIIDRLGAGGGKCDWCGKKAKSMEDGELFQCSRCTMAYYCSSTCQKKAWRSGHRQACRAPGEIVSDDIMLVQGLVGKPELNQKLVRVIKAATSEGRWEVKVQGSSNIISLASKNLSHIRPAK